jgi:sugar-specific transcriptional regulator TrmB
MQTTDKEGLMNVDSQTTQSLINLGLTSLEAEIYTLLLQKSPVTGYAVAKELGKPAPNVYKALEKLEAKGAVELEHGRTRLCRPVPAAELLDMLERRFRQHRDQAAEGLRRLPGPVHDARIYHLRDPEQVAEKFRQLLSRAKSIALIDVHWDSLESLTPDLEDTARRDVIVALKVYTKVNVKGADVILHPQHEEIRTRWPAQWIVMVVDGSQILLAIASPDGSRVVQAVWSSSPFLSWILHSSLHHEIAWSATCRKLEDGEPVDPVKTMEALNERYKAPQAEGYRRLRGQLGLAEETGST